jgi:hypothetical protein
MKNWKDLLIAGLLGVLLGQGVNLAYAEDATPWTAPPPTAETPAGFSVCGRISISGDTEVPAGWTVMGYAAVPQISTTVNMITGQDVHTLPNSRHYMMVCH